MSITTPFPSVLRNVNAKVLSVLRTSEGLNFEARS